MALVQARFNVARFGASRFNWLSHYVVQWDYDGDTYTPLVGTLSIAQGVGEPPRASYTLQTAQTVGHDIQLFLGDLTHNRIFGGTITRVTKRFPTGASGHAVYDVEATGYQWLLDRRLVNARYTSTAADTIVKDLIADYATGFTTAGVASGLASVDEIVFTMETMTGALNRLANAIGGYWYVDEVKDLHFFTSESPYNLPAPLNTSYPYTLQNFQHHKDLSEVRTRVYVEGKAASATFDVPSGYYAIPMDTDEIFTSTFASGVKVNHQILTSTQASFVEGYGGGSWYINTYRNTLSTSATQGVTAIALDDAFDSQNVAGWVKVGDQFIYYETANGITHTLSGVPSSGPGSVAQTMSSGTEVVSVPCLVWSALNFALDHTVKAGDRIALLVQRDSTDAQSTIASVEGGDGIHEHYIQDGRLSEAGAINRADTELALRNTPIETITFRTTDPNCRPGLPLTVDLGGVTGTFTIQQVQIRLGASDQRSPWRDVEARTKSKVDLYAYLRRLEGVA